MRNASAEYGMRIENAECEWRMQNAECGMRTADQPRECVLQPWQNAECGMRNSDCVCWVEGRVSNYGENADCGLRNSDCVCITGTAVGAGLDYLNLEVKLGRNMYV